MIQYLWSEVDLFQRHQFEALLGAHIHASATQDTSRSVCFIAFENRIDPAAKTPACFAHCAFLIEADFNFRHTRPAGKRQHGHGFAVQLDKIREHAMVIENFDFDLGLGLLAPGEVFVDPRRNAPAVQPDAPACEAGWLTLNEGGDHLLDADGSLDRIRAAG